MNILVTGYRGFIGQHMTKALIDKGHSVSTYEWGEQFPGVLGQDWVVHLGAISSTTEKDVEKVLTQNLDFSCELFDQCKKFGVNLQYASSASVYGLISTFKEDAPVDPRTPYAWSKYLFERYHQKHQGGNIVQGFRYFNVYGPNGEDHKADQASPFAKFQRQVAETGQVKIFKNSEQYSRDFVQVNDLVELQTKFLSVTDSGIWNIGTGRTQSFRQVAELYTDCIVEIPLPDILQNSYQKYTCADMTKTRSTLAKFDLL